jgi:hypothetical protein
MLFKNIEVGSEFTIRDRKLVKVNPGLGQVSNDREFSKYLYQAFLPDTEVTPYPNPNFSGSFNFSNN